MELLSKMFCEGVGKLLILHTYTVFTKDYTPFVKKKTYYHSSLVVLSLFSNITHLVQSLSC